MASLADLVPDDCTNPHDAARRAIRKAFATKQTDLLVPAVAKAISDIWREAVREPERRVFGAGPRIGRVLVDAATLLEQSSALAADPDLALLLTCTFHVTRGGQVVTWGDATRDQHEMRAAFLDDMAAATVETANRHRRAVKVLAEAGVDTLNELFGRRP